MATDWTEARLASLRALCDCFFPSLSHADDPHGFWARKASDFGIDVAAAQIIDAALPEPARSGLVGLIDALGQLGIASVPAEVGEQMVRGVAASSVEAGLGVVGLQQLVLSLCYALPDAAGQNPNWRAISYPGPVRAAKPSEKRIKPLDVDVDELTLEADVCIVGSGAGGGVIAGELSKRGLKVVVLEAGGYFGEGDFNQLEMWAYQNLYWRGGFNPTADSTVSLISGATLGGGTTVNWHNCVRTPSWVREEWEREHGLTGLAGDAFEHHLSGVLERIGANDRCSDLNGPHQRLEEATKALGYSFKRCMLNLDPKKYEADVAGFNGFGDLTGARMGTLNTYLDDAYQRGAKILVRTRAQRIMTSQGRATGVVAISTGADGKSRTVIVRAPNVVSACGALETPALLKRSGIGGPAVGDHLHLHPVVAMTGAYKEDQRAWWGPPQSGLSDQFLRLKGDHGILIECSHHSLMVAAGATPWESGRAHKELMADSPRYAGFIGIVRDRGHGRVEVDANGESVPTYPVQDRLDIENLQRAIRELTLLHQAAGADRIVGTSQGVLHSWYPGDDIDKFIATLTGPLGTWPGLPLFSAHQMGSARMGRDPATSVAKPTGELHDTRGVWVGDTSAFPSALGVNPMVTCMALAARTADFIGEAAGAKVL
jgi:choline dehydrogenase-like flavoprotein